MMTEKESRALLYRQGKRKKDYALELSVVAMCVLALVLVGLTFVL